jgi:hypothetical protein
VESAEGAKIVSYRKIDFEGIFLDDSANVFPHIVALRENFVPAHARCTGCRGKKRCQNFNRGRFSRAIWAEQSKNLTFLYFERNAVQCVNRRVFAPGKNL